MRAERRHAGRRRSGAGLAPLVLLLLIAATAVVLLRARALDAAGTPDPAPTATAEPTPPLPPPEPTPTPEYQAVFFANGEETVLTAQEGTAVEPPAVATPTGYTFFGWADESGVFPPDGEIFLSADTRFEAVVRVTLGGEAHTAYLPLESSGCFRPDESLLRGEAALMLSRLITAEAEPGEGFSDLTKDDACFKAANALKALGILDGEEFRPDEPLTMGALLQILARFYPPTGSVFVFSDLPETDEAYPAFCLALERGWLDYAEGMEALPEAQPSRLQIARLMNRVLGRSADPAILDEDLSAISDLPEEPEDRLTLLEAALPHTSEAGETHEIWIDHEIPLQPIPGFSTGDLELDAWLEEILDEKTNEKMTLKEKLRALYNYVRDTFRYRKGEVYEEADPQILVIETRKMMEEAGGNCWTHASLLCELYRAVGVPAKVYGGTLGNTMNPHAWVEADIDGRTYVFDPEMEKTILRFHKDYYDFFMRTLYDVKGWDYQRDFVIE